MDWIQKRIVEFNRILSKQGNLILYCKRQSEHIIKSYLEEQLHEQRMIIWARRRDRNNTRGKTLASGYEILLWYSKTENNFIFNSNNAKIPPQPHLRKRKEYLEGGRLEKGVSLSDVWLDIPALPHNSKEKTFHPTQKPIALGERIVKLFSTRAGKIYIPFAGSGSEIIACMKLKREWIATENNALYFDLIKQQIAKFMQA